MANKIKAITNVFYYFVILMTFFLSIVLNLPFEYAFMLLVLSTLWKIELNTQGD